MGELAFIDGAWVMMERCLVYPVPVEPAKPQPRIYRPRYSGSFYRTRGRYWIGALSIPGRNGEKRTRRRVFGNTFCVMLKRFSALEKPPQFADALKMPVTIVNPRSINLRGAQELGTHTGAEWREKLRAQNGRCHYCGATRPLQKEHMVPITRGGSDAIDNLVGACRDCNSEKRTFTADEFMENRICW